MKRVLDQARVKIYKQRRVAMLAFASFAFISLTLAMVPSSITWTLFSASLFGDTVSYKEASLQELKQMDVDYCQSFFNDTKREDCFDRLFLETAKIKKNPDLCNDISSINAKSACRQYFDYVYASTADFPEACYKVYGTPYFESCYKNTVIEQAKAQENTNMCNRLFWGAKKDCHNAVNFL